MINAILKYADGSPDFNIGGFDSDKAIDDWISHASCEPGWKKDCSVVRIPEIVVPVVIDPTVKEKQDAAKNLLKNFDKSKIKPNDVADLIEAVAIVLGAK